MPVKSATKLKLINLGFTRLISHALAFDRKWDAVILMSFEEVWLCVTEYAKDLHKRQGVQPTAWFISMDKLKLYRLMEDAKFNWIEFNKSRGRVRGKELQIEKDRAELWWPVITKENKILLGLRKLQFLNWTTKYPIK